MCQDLTPVKQNLKFRNKVQIILDWMVYVYNRPYVEQ